MPTVLTQSDTKPSEKERQTTLFRDALAAVEVSEGNIFEFKPLEVSGISLSDLIVRERRGE